MGFRRALVCIALLSGLAREGWAEEPEETAVANDEEETSATTPPRYLPAMQDELGKMRVQATCRALTGTRARCTYTHRDPITNQALQVGMLYSDGTDTVYMYVDPYLTVPGTSPEAPAVLRRLMELNWALLAPKFEWDAATGQVRISVVLHTDSNFDRRAFRSLASTLVRVAARFYTELAHLSGVANPPQSERER